MQLPLLFIPLDSFVCYFVAQLCLTLCDPIWTIALQAPLSMGFSRPEYWSGLPCSPPGDLPNPGIEPESLTFLALAGRFFTTLPCKPMLLTQVAPNLGPLKVCYSKRISKH